MIIINVCNEIFIKDPKDLTKTLKNNFNNEILEKLYFIPKKISKDSIERKLNDKNYITKVLNTINYFKNKNIEELIRNKLKFFESETSNKILSGKIYTIIGLDTTTIYSTNVDGEDVTVLLLESTSGDEETLDILLAHEFTHFIRKQKLNKDIFGESIGERFISEGIAINYSREIVPNKSDSKYCLVSDETVQWVKNNLNVLEKHMKSKKTTKELMSDYFSMYADIAKTGIPPRTGYVYGYLKVKEYLEKNNLKIKDIIDLDWKTII